MIEGSGVPGAPGVALGPVFFVTREELTPSRVRIDASEVAIELERFADAVERVVAELARVAEEVESSAGREEAAIFEAHIELARDPELAAEVQTRIRDLESAEAAVRAVGEAFAGRLAALEDEYLAARADDVRDVARQVVAELLSGSGFDPRVPAAPSVIVARNLAPSDVARIPKELALAFVTAEGSATSHVAILARALQIPAVVGVGALVEDARAAREAGVDGELGRVVLDPDAEARRRLEERRAAAEREARDLEAFRHVRARTRSGREIEVAANVGSVEEARTALEQGADGIGLFRTEFLFMDRDELPSEDEQYAAYRSVAKLFAPRPVVVRTLDVGGDKPLPGVDAPREDNPFLGWRGIRMSLETPELFRPQLRAVLRAAAHGNVRVMFPMVAELSELRAARAVFDECRAELEAAGAGVGPVEAGVMVETPAAALAAEELAAEAAFLSIGTNDLTQYTLAADRGNPRLRRLQDQGHPAVLRLVEMTCRAATAAGIPVAVCGEAAGDPALVPTLLDLGVSELSVSPTAIPRVKKTVSDL